MATAQFRDIIRLEQVSCCVLNCTYGTNELAKLKKRTVTMKTNSHENGDGCLLVISEKSKELYCNHVTLCGLIQDTSSTKSWVSVNMKRHLILIFDSITLEVITDDKKERAHHVLDDCERACKTYLGYVSTDLLLVENPSKSWRGLNKNNRVLFSVMKSRVSLSAEDKPYNSIVTWHTEDISSVVVSNNALKLEIRNEGTFVFTSKMNTSLCSNILKRIEPYLNLYDKICNNYIPDQAVLYDQTYDIDLNEYARSVRDYLHTAPTPDTQETSASQGAYEYEQLPSRSAFDSDTLIAKTLEKVVQCKPPARDTLQLPTDIRRTLCFKLYSDSILPDRKDWQIFAERTGLNTDAVNMISSLVKNHFVDCPAAEIVLRHWQFMFNKYGETELGGPCPRACNKTELKKLLRELERYDLLQLVELNN